jgi:oligopeptide/dipeptide ABC transporter ATP-binding protein
MSGPLLVVDGLQAGFRSRQGFVRAIDGVSFSVERGGSFGVVGESGCGKSSLSLALMGLLPDNAEVRGGSARFEGRDLLGMSADERRRLRGRRMAMVFQDPLTSLDPFMRVGHQVDEQIRLHLGLDRAAARRRTLDLFASVGIPEPERRARHYPHELSGGQRQRVMIAMALSCDPDLLIADEPTTALDVTVQAQVLDLIRAEQRKRGMALILITHNLGVVAGMCERVAVMYAGRFVEVAPAATLFADPRHPYTRGLFAAVPRLDGAPGAALAAIPGAPPRLTAPPSGCAFAPRCLHASEECRLAPPPLRQAGATEHRCIKDLPAEPGHG